MLLKYSYKLCCLNGGKDWLRSGRTQKFECKDNLTTIICLIASYFGILYHWHLFIKYSNFLVNATIIRVASFRLSFIITASLHLERFYCQRTSL